MTVYRSTVAVLGVLRGIQARRRDRGGRCTTRPAHPKSHSDPGLTRGEPIGPTNSTRVPTRLAFDGMKQSS